MSDGPKTLRDWIQYLHAAAEANAAAEQSGTPDPEAQEAIAFALQRIQRLQLASDVADQPAAPGAVGSTLAALAHGGSLGTGEVFAGLGSAAQGKGFRTGAQGYRESLGEIEAAHPYLAAGGELAGGFALPAGQIGQTVGRGIKAGVPLGVRGALSLVGRGAAAGAAPGAVQGFSTGGEDSGDIGARFRGAGQGAAIGGALGALASGVAIPIVRRNVERSADIGSAGVRRANEVKRGQLLDQQLRRGAPQRPSRVVGSVVDDIRQAQDDFAAGRISEEDFNTAMEMAVAQERGIDLRPSPKAEPDPVREIPTYQRRAVERIPSRVPETQVMERALERPAGRPGHPIYSGTRAPTRSKEVRGGERLLPKAKEPPSPAVNLGAADGYLRAGNTSQLDRFDPGELAARLESLPNVGPTQRARVMEYLSRKLTTPPARGSLP